MLALVWYVFVNKHVLTIKMRVIHIHCYAMTTFILQVYRYQQRNIPYFTPPSLQMFAKQVLDYHIIMNAD